MEPRSRHDYRPRDPQYLARDLIASVYMAAMSAKGRDPEQTIEILQATKEALQRVKAPDEPVPEVLPHAADIERMASQPWKRGKARKLTRTWNEEDDDAPYDM